MGPAVPFSFGGGRMPEVLNRRQQGLFQSGCVYWGVQEGMEHKGSQAQPLLGMSSMSACMVLLFSLLR